MAMRAMRFTCCEEKLRKCRAGCLVSGVAGHAGVGLFVGGRLVSRFHRARTDGADTCCGGEIGVAGQGRVGLRILFHFFSLFVFVGAPFFPMTSTASDMS